METIIRDVEPGDWHAISEIFNHFVSNSLAAYPDDPVVAMHVQRLRDGEKGTVIVMAEK